MLIYEILVLLVIVTYLSMASTKRSLISTKYMYILNTNQFDLINL